MNFPKCLATFFGSAFYTSWIWILATFHSSIMEQRLLAPAILLTMFLTGALVIWIVNWMISHWDDDFADEDSLSSIARFMGIIMLSSLYTSAIWGTFVCSFFAPFMIIALVFTVVAVIFGAAFVITFWND
jgi:hypothetical protein